MTTETNLTPDEAKRFSELQEKGYINLNSAERKEYAELKVKAVDGATSDKTEKSETKEQKKEPAPKLEEIIRKQTKFIYFLTRILAFEMSLRYAHCGMTEQEFGDTIKEIENLNQQING